MGRILVIDDEPSTQILLQSRLRDLGHEAVIAQTGAMGLMECRAQSFDLFLVDLHLGSGIDGYEVCRRLKTRPQTRTIPVVLISGQMTTREDLHRGYEAGCEAFLIKGDYSLLEDVTRAMLRIKALQDDLALQNQLLEQRNRSLSDEKQRGANLELALREQGSGSGTARSGHGGGSPPDGMLIVGEDGIVRYADRGARDMLCKDIEGRQLGSLVRGSGLEAYVRDSRTEQRQGFRFEVQQRNGSGPAAFVAAVVPLTSSPGEGESDMRAVMIFDERRQSLAEEVLGLQTQGIARRDLGPLLEAAGRTFHPSSVLGISPAMGELRSRIGHAALAEHPVFLAGESGTGKELIARVLHFSGSRSGPFIPLHCGSLSGRVLESELFGHVQGAFPEAVADRPGLLLQGHLGTVYLEEVGELPLELQARLLSALKEGRTKRTGASQTESVDVRIIASSTRNLERAVQEGTFMRELYSVLSNVALAIPPLRERAGDVRILAQAFLARHGSPQSSTEISEEALWIMEAADWPGNVRELERCIERACSLARGRAIEVRDLPLPLQDLHLRLRRPDGAILGKGLSVISGAPLGSVPAPLPGGVALQTLAGSAGALHYEDGDGEPVSLELYEKKALLRALRETDNDKLAAARLLKVGKSTLYRKLKRYGIK